MDWLIITESEEKAAALRRCVPEATVIPTGGIPWDVRIEIQGNGIHPIKEAKEKMRQLLKRIENESLEKDRILLAFEPTTTGEACAKEFELLLGRDRCARWQGHNLEERSLRSEIGDLETLSGKELPKASAGIAESYWIQRTIDITWADKIKRWLAEKTSRDERLSRLMAAMLKTIADETRKRELYQSKKYWELRCRIRATGAGESGPRYATAVVPTLGQLGGETTPKTLDVWKKRIAEAKRLAVEGRGVAQPEPGQPWRYESWEDVASQKAHLEKFPYFVVQTQGKGAKKNPRRPPLTATSVSELACATEKGSIEQTEKALNELYLLGWITQPKSTNPNLSKKALQELLSYGARTGLAVERDLKNFGESEEGNRWQEAIRPTRWERTPETVAALLPENEARPRKAWLYRMIYQHALESQLEMEEITTTRCYMLGPLYMRRKAAAEKGGETFATKKETRLGAHMNVILAAEWEENAPEEGTAILCSSVEAHERTTQGPPPLTEEELIKSMNSEGLGKRKTLKSQIAQLRKDGCIQSGDLIKLTPKGASLCSLLNNHFGQFLDKNYHRSVAEALLAVEENQADGPAFLQEWWDCFRTYLEEENP